MSHTSSRSLALTKDDDDESRKRRVFSRSVGRSEVPCAGYLDLLHLSLAHFEEARIPNRASLDDLSHPGPKFPLSSCRVSAREAVEESHIHEDHRGLMEGSDQILAVGRVDGRLPPQDGADLAVNRKQIVKIIIISPAESKTANLATNTCIDHSKKRRRYLDERNAAHKCCCDVSCEIPDNAAAESYTTAVPIHFVLQTQM